MIRIVLLGRTGNHLFQYALGRVLAEKHSVPLVMDASWFNAEGWAEVSHFLRLPLKAKVVRRCSIGARALRNFTGKHYWEYRGVPILRETGDDQSFDARFLDAPADCVLFGYFQSPLYFNKIAAPLREELNYLLKAAVRIQEDLRAKLAHCNSVAVHVRRKDYLVLPIFQVCDRDYYQRSMNEMRARLPAARFFIFSDDPAWCRGEFQDADTEVIDSGEAANNPLHDLLLMSLTSHHIIANSTYSWWAAWLGDKIGQQVIMPERWYAHGIKAPMEEKQWQLARF
ncbi:MAG: alpha-1,2-fucosyltransferase [Akkermansiaceae bacterium]|nr:alpha-1,2-fucosyltransferase [Akkermansiaceae bacterium]